MTTQAKEKVPAIDWTRENFEEQINNGTAMYAATGVDDEGNVYVGCWIEDAGGTVEIHSIEKINS